MWVYALAVLCIVLILHFHCDYFSPNVPFPTGASVTCTTYDPKGLPGVAVYKVVGNGFGTPKRIGYYPTPEIAASWNPEWNVDINKIPDCSPFKFNGDLQMKPAGVMKYDTSKVY